MPLPPGKIAKCLSGLFLIIVFSLIGCASGTTNSLEPKQGTITGKVVASSSIVFKIAYQEALTGTVGVPGAVCTIEGTDKSATTDEQGSFTITDVSPGSYIVICRKTASDGKVFAFLKIAEVQPGQTSDTGTIQVTQTGAIQGKVTLTDQTDHTGISVYIPGTSMSARTDATGAYLINNVPEGTYELRFEKSGYMTRKITGLPVIAGETALAEDMTLNLSTGASGIISIENGKVYSNSRTVTVYIMASDDATLYQISDNPNFIGAVWNTIPPSKTWIFDSDGEKRLYAKFADANGLESAPASDSIIIDTTPPANPTSAAGYSSSSKTTTLTAGNSYNYSTPYFEWSGASDSNSGVVGYYVYFGTDDAADPATSGTYQTSASYAVSVALTSGSTYYLRIKAKDNAGHIASGTYTAFTFQYDSSGPTNTTGSNFINSGAASTNSTNVTLTLSATDNAGVTGYCAKESSATPSVNDTCWTSITSTTSYSAGVTFTLSTGDGAKTVYVWFKDAAGNIFDVASDSITLALPPSAPTGVTAATGDGQVTISWNAVSGATSYNIYWSTTSEVTKTTGTKISSAKSPYTHTGRTNGTAYYYVVTAVNDNGESRESAEVTVTPQAPPVPLPKTGQTTCYDSSGIVIACAGTGQDGDLQRGVVWPSPRFTVGTGIEADCVIDNLSGLMWKNNPGYAGRTWQEAFDDANNLSLCGYRDWRLPNINEIMSLINVSEPNTAQWLNNHGFYGVSGPYWSSTSDASRSDYTWVVQMSRPYMVSYNKSSMGGHAVWTVRSVQTLPLGLSGSPSPRTGQTTCYDYSGNMIDCAGTGQDGEIRAGVAWPSPRFKVSTDGYCATDNLTGLMWVRSPDSVTRTWQEALDYANNLSLCGYTDWLLPNINELRSLINVGEPDTAQWLNNQGFSNVSNVHEYYWSSTTDAEDSRFAWFISMYNGNLDIYGKSSSMYYAWPVRSGE